MLNNGCLICGRELGTGSINGLCQSCYNKSINNNFSIEYHGDFSIDPPINNGCIRYVDKDKVLALIRGVIAKEKDEHTLKVLKSLYYDLLRMEEGSGIGRIGDVVTCPSHPDGTTDINGFDITTIDYTRTETVGSVDNITAEVGEDPIIALKDLEETITKLKKERDKWFRAYQEADAINSQLDSDNRKLKEELKNERSNYNRVELNLLAEYEKVSYLEKELKSCRADLKKCIDELNELRLNCESDSRGRYS